MRDAGADDIGVHVSSSRVGRPAARWSDRDAYKAERGRKRDRDAYKAERGRERAGSGEGKGWMARSLELRCCGTAGLRGWVVWARVNEGGVARVGRAWRHSYGGDRSGIRGLPEGAAAPTSPRPPLAHNALPRRSPTRLHPTRSLSLAPSLSLPLSLPLSSSRREQRRACLEDLSRWLFPRRKRFRRADRVLGMHGEGQNGWPSSWRRCFRLGRMYVGVGFGFLFFSWGLLLFENLFITLHNWWFLNFQVNFSEFCDSIIIIRYIYVVV